MVVSLKTWATAEHPLKAIPGALLARRRRIAERRVLTVGHVYHPSDIRRLVRGACDALGYEPRRLLVLFAGEKNIPRRVTRRRPPSPPQREPLSFFSFQIIKRIFAALQNQQIKRNIAAFRQLIQPIEKILRKSHSARYVGISQRIVNFKHRHPRFISVLSFYYNGLRGGKIEPEM